MKKIHITACLALTVALLGTLLPASAVTLKTTSIFAGSDAAAEVYTNLLKSWQEATGHEIIDSSSTSDEAWKSSVLNDFAAGNEADILFFFANSSDNAPILNKVVPISEINAAYPDLHLPEDGAIAEANGVVYAIPIRRFWEGLFCNIDLFETYDIELPTTWERFETAIRKFNAVGITPFSVSLSDVPNYLGEFTILSAGPPEDHAARPGKGQPVPESWLTGMRLIRHLNDLNAFPEDANATTNDIIGQRFISKQAAMQLDGSWFANGLPPENMDTTIVMPFPCYSPDADPTVFIGGVSMGFYLTRAAWEREETRDAAVSLLAHLTTGENAEALGGFTITGKLLESSREMHANATTINPAMQDVMDPAARQAWFAAIPDVATGELGPALLWASLMEMAPFGE